MAPVKPPSLQVVRRFDAAAERVFDAWLDPNTAGKWLFATATGQMIRVEIDPRVGGSFNFTRREGDDIEHVGEYLVIDRPRRLGLHVRRAEVFDRDHLRHGRNRPARERLRAYPDPRERSAGVGESYRGGLENDPQCSRQDAWMTTNREASLRDPP